jgi:pimeloyl-ACP methyl ester carboxylesterase
VNNRKYLQAYYPFDAAIVHAIARAANTQDVLSYAELLARYNLTSVPEIIPATSGYKAFEVLTITPSGSYSKTEARILYLSMACSIAQSSVMRALRLFASDPTQQIIVSGNPAALGCPYNKIRMANARSVARGDLSATVDPLLALLASRGIKTIDALGYSYGADKAATASIRAAQFGIQVRRGVFVEPATSTQRSLQQLRIAFTAAGEALPRYIADANSPPLNEARQLSSVSQARYIAGFLRLSNLAIVTGLTHPYFKQRVEEALIAQPGMHVTIAWGSLSELAPAKLIESVVQTLQANNVFKNRLSSMILRGMYHAGADDINLHAAILLQGLRN